MGLNGDMDRPGDAPIDLTTVVRHQRLLEGLGRNTAHVSPMTSRGTVRVLAWLVATAAIGLLGWLLVPALGRWWVAIALAVMVWVAIRFDRRREPPT